ncbi:hypothetical protein NC652_010450 [Populus alba x Populus x berolinensis]|uniref:NAC domain-containing protein n=1 Tax=Populus tomentosa TaxID=118781 RepID=A0A8X8A2W9_POPTO|nr:hypothetical protein POTOM_015402 [Populus tomentosa]KAJ6935437.1 hypothetical protein NC652_010450 [Populus alba x Populus x berolinensis]
MAPVSLPPGFRFHPTDEELVAYYLRRKINAHKIELEIIPEVDLYKCEPWDLPGKSLLPSKDLEWYFFSPRDRKYPNGSRTNRATKAGYWKATGKDRKVISQMRAVGMKKTLVYYRGRAPHGARTGWVMHEYRLDERECEINTGLQDAYALCRVSKRTANIPKIGEHYDSTTNQMPCEHSSSIEQYSENHGRCEEYESTNYTMHRNVDSCSTSYRAIGSPLNIGESRNGKWIQSMDGSFGMSAPQFPNYSTVPYPPSKVDIALECARLQHRFTLPPLEVEDFPQFGFTDMKMMHQPSMPESTSTHQTDILQEILSVAHASQELINQSSFQDTWGGNYATADHDFTFMAGKDVQHNVYSDMTMNSTRWAEKPWVDPSTSSMSIEMSDLDETFKAERMVENLRWVGMSNDELEKSFTEETKIVPIENISNFRSREEHGVLGENGHTGDCMRFNDSEDFSLGFINDEPNDDNFIEESNIVDDLASSPSFEVVEDIKVNHGLFVSTRQETETFFHQLVPSQTVKIYLNPAAVAANFSIEKVENTQRYDIKPSKTTAKESFTGSKSSAQYPWRCLASNVVCMIVILLMHCFYLGENVENGKSTANFMGSGSGSVEEVGFCPSKNIKPMKKLAGKLIIKRDDNEKEKDLLVTIRGGEGSKLGLFLKKLGLFLTISFALCTMLANHAMAS